MLEGSASMDDRFGARRDAIEIDSIQDCHDTVGINACSMEDSLATRLIDRNV